MRHVEDPKRKENRSETKKVNEMQNNNKTWQAFKKPISLGFECDKYKHDFVLIQKERHQTVDFRWKKKLRKL